MNGKFLIYNAVKQPNSLLINNLTTDCGLSTPNKSTIFQ